MLHPLRSRGLLFTALSFMLAVPGVLAQDRPACKAVTTTTTTCEQDRCKEIVSTVETCSSPTPSSLPPVDLTAGQADKANDFVIAGHSARRTVGLAGQELTGTYAVSLAKYGTQDQTYEPLSVAECANAKVHFELLTPKDPGFTPQNKSSQAARFIFGQEAMLDFPDSYHESLGADIKKRLAQTLGARAWNDSLLAIIKDRSMLDADQRDSLNTLVSICVAEAPLKLGETVGNQVVTATIEGSGLGSGASQRLAGRGDQDGLGAVSFTPVRAHARPRLMVGGIYSVGDYTNETAFTLDAIPDDTLPSELHGEAFTKDEKINLTRPRIEPLIAFDFPIEPYLKRSKSKYLLARIRPTIGVVLDNKAIGGLYLGASLPTLITGFRAASVPIDITAGLLLDLSETPDDDPNAREHRLAFSIVVNANDVFAGLGKAIGIGL